MDQTAMYQVLAGSLMSVCGKEFKRAELVAKLDAGYSRISYNCETSAGLKEGLDSPLDIDLKVDDTLHNLRENWPGQPWSSCTFTLLPDGQFKFDVAYDD